MVLRVLVSNYWLGEDEEDETMNARMNISTGDLIRYERVGVGIFRSTQQIVEERKWHHLDHSAASMGCCVCRRHVILLSQQLIIELREVDGGVLTLIYAIQNCQ